MSVIFSTFFILSSLHAQEIETGNYQETILIRDSALGTNNSLLSNELPGVFSTEDSTSSLPNISAIKGSNKTRFIQARGIGQYEDFSPLTRRSNQFYLDEIDYTQFPQAYEVFGFSNSSYQYGSSLRGATGVTFHSNEKLPEKNNQARLQITQGSFGHQAQKAAFRSSKSTLLSPDFSAIRIIENGYYNNTYLGRDDTNAREEFYLRSSLRSPRLAGQQLVYRFHYNNLNNGYDAFVQDNGTTTSSDHPGQDDLTMQVHQLTLDSQKKNKFILEYMNTRTFYSYDEDWGNDGQWLNTDGFNSVYNYFIEFSRKHKRYSVKDIYDDNQNHIELSYVQSSEKHLERGYTDEAPRSNIDTQLIERTTGINGSRLISLGNESTLEFGIGYQRHQLNMSDGSFGEKINENLLHTKLIGGYRNYFLSLSSAEIAGGINMQSAVPKDRKIFESERAITVESGIKNEWGKLNLFYTKRLDPQVKTSYQADPGDPSTYTYYNDNVGSATHYGLEMNSSWRDVKWFKLDVNLGLLKTQFGDYPFGDRNLKDRELPNSPEYQFVVAPTLSPMENFSIRTELRQQDDFYFSNSHEQQAKGYRLVNIKASYSFKNASISILMNNLLDETYPVRGFYFGNTPPNFENQLYTQQGRPRFIGLTLDMSI